MIKFDSLDVVKTKENFHYIMWDVSVVFVAPPIDPPIPPADSPDNYYYVVYWSNDPKSGFHSIKNDDRSDVQIDGATGPLAITHYRKHYNFNEKFYYCVVAYHKTDPFNAVKSIVVYQGQHLDGVHIQIKRVEDTLYGFYYGEPCLVIKRKSYGAPCTNCWSESRQQRTKSNCPICQNTGHVFGYYQPIPIQISFDSDPTASDVQKDYEVVTDTKRGRLSNYPLVRLRDLVICLDDNKRYTITHIETTKLPVRSTYDDITGEKFFSKQNYVISQLLTMQEISADDQEYYMNYDSIPTECYDYSLPRFQSHPMATGITPIAVLENQVVTLKYDEDFEVTTDGKLSLKNPLDKTGILQCEYVYMAGFNSVKVMDSLTQNIIPDDTITSKLKTIFIGIDKSGEINSTNPAVIRVAEFDGNSDTEYLPGSGVTKYLNDFAAAGSMPGVKYYSNFTIDVSADNIIMTPDKTMFIDINPNGSWAFDTVRVTVELELRMN